VSEAARDGADIVALSKFFIAGYPPEENRLQTTHSRIVYIVGLRRPHNGHRIAYTETADRQPSGSTLMEAPRLLPVQNVNERSRILAVPQESVAGPPRPHRSAT
jgi:hypothetical protein